MLHQIAEMTVKIKQYDQAIKRAYEDCLSRDAGVDHVYGVGHLTALTFVLTLGKKERFRRNRDVRGTQAYDPDAASRETATPAWH